MTKNNFKEEAILLRKNGLSYSEILKKIPVAKSTISLWLRSVGLSKEQKQRLTDKKLASALRGAIQRKKIRLKKTEVIKNDARKNVPKLINDPLWLAGTMLYWAEGSKEKPWRTGEKVAISNMSPEVHVIFLAWINKYFNVKRVDLKYELFIHEGNKVDKMKYFWVDNLNIPLSRIRTYFKKNNPNPKRKNLGDNYNGVLKIVVPKSVDLNRRIAGWIDGVVEFLT